MTRFLSDLDPYMSRALKFVVRELLKYRVFSVLDHFARIFTQMEEKVPGVLPPLGKALVQLAEYPFLYPNFVRHTSALGLSFFC